MDKLKCVIYAPIDTYSGYGAHSRDKVKALIELYKDEWDIRIISCAWGNTPFGFINDHKEEWGFLANHILQQQLSYQPDIMFWITIPAEAQVWGKWNCLITAGIETTVCDASWIKGVNRMNLTLASSNHSKNVFESSKFQVKNPQGQVVENIELNKPVEVVFEGIKTEVYKHLEPKEITSIDLSEIKEDFCYLFVGHWIQGVEDRKGVSTLIRAFYETFKNKPNTPALILKTSGAGSSYMDKREILKKIKDIRETIVAKTLPTIYVLHGEFNDAEMNEIYNHPKVKAMVSLTRGEGYGRPLAEFSQSKKPIIVSNWSGHLDFLHPDYTYLISGEIKQLHPSSVVPNMLLAESGWFYPNVQDVNKTLLEVYNNYAEAKVNGKRNGHRIKTEFSYEKMKERMKEVFTKYIPEFPKQVELKLPQLKKIELPKKPEPQPQQ